MRLDEIRNRRRAIADLLTERWEANEPIDDLRAEIGALNAEEKAIWVAKRAAETPTGVEFTDSEYAVIYDSLAAMRDKLDERGIAAPNVMSALHKLGSMARPEGCEFIAFWGEDRQLLSDVLVK